MTITEMARYFDILQDKFGSPYFTNPEKSLLLNRAQVIFVKEMLPTDADSDLSLETNADTVAVVSPLIVALTPIQNPSNGSVTKTNMQSNLTALIAGALYWRVLNIGYSIDGTSFVPVKYVRHNDWYAFMDNYFKNPDDSNPKYKETYIDFQFLPNNISANLYFTVLKYPALVDIDTNISSDLPDSVHDKVVSIALELAGIGTRDEMLSALSRLKHAQN